MILSSFGVSSPWLHTGHLSPDSDLFIWSFEPTLLAAVVVGVVGYLYVVGPLRRRNRLGRPVSTMRMASWMVGIGILFLAVASPLDFIGKHYLFSVHMAQHLLLLLVAAPLLVTGLPPWIVRVFPYSRRVHAIAGALTFPVAAFLISSSVFLIWHAPALYDAALGSGPIHELEHITIISAGMLMWWPVLSTVRTLPAIPAPAQILYYFLLPIPTSIVGALITFSEDLLYETYAAVPRIWGLSAAIDQEIAGLLLWVPGKLVFWLALGIAFFRWFAEEDSPKTTAVRREL